MSSSKEDLKGLPEIYLSPSRSRVSGKHGGILSSDTEVSVLDDTDSELWTTLVPEMTATDGAQLVAVISEGGSPNLSLGQREEIEGVSSVDSPLNSNNFLPNRSQTNFYLQREPEGSRTYSTASASQSTHTAIRQNARDINRDGHWKHQRGETPGSDCPPVVGMGALSRVFRQPLDLNLNTTQSPKNELIFSPGGDEGFMVPGGVCAYYGTGSGSDTEGVDWNTTDEGVAQDLGPSRNVEGADNATPNPQVYANNILTARIGPENLERNTPDAAIDLRFRAEGGGVILSQTEAKTNIRPPVVGQSEEQVQTATRKDLGSTDGEESEDDGGQKRLTLMRDNMPSDIQLSSLGSQSENTDSVNTVLDMSRGEVQGCETDDTLHLSPSQVLETAHLHHNPKPTFVVGGLIAPRGKYKGFQNTIRGRMQDMIASLELEPNSEAKILVDRDHFLSQPPLCPQGSTISEQEASLTSMVSVESTNHPESSDRVTSPSVLSVSSAASSKRLEWDSGADVGYSGNTPEQITSSLSTLERIALGSYASVLRTEPEGTTYVSDKQKTTKKSAKGVIVKSAGTASLSKRSNPEKNTASTLCKSVRGQHSKERYKMSSSEEDFERRFSSPVNSPRRRPRRRPNTSNLRKLDLPVRISTEKTKKTFGRLHEILQELNSEGKASSLVELNQTSRLVPEYRRSNSQQSLLYSGDTSGKQSDAVSSTSVAAGSSTSVVTAVCFKAKPESSSVTATATSMAAVSSQMLKVESKRNQTLKNKKPLQSKELPKITATGSREKLVLLNSNEGSSKSHGSSDETLSDIKDTDGESCPSSNLVSDEEPMNLKARKNSENAKNHENIAKLNLKSSNSRSDLCQAQKKNDDSSSSSSLQRSLLESQVSIQSSNNSLQALSVRLREKIQALLDSGTMRKVQDYNKLQDYVVFIGMPSTTEEECQLKHGVASVIMRMFGEIGADDTDASNLNSETSDPVTPNSPSDYKAETMSVNTLFSHDDISHDVGASSGDDKIVSTTSKGDVTSDEGSRSVTPSNTVKIVPYRPPSSTRTYFMAVSCNFEDGVVEGERVTTPEGEHFLPGAVNAQEDDFRGQAEGQRELVTDDSELSSPTPYHNEFRRDYPRHPSEENDNAIPARDWEDDESESISGATALSREWNNVMKLQMISNVLPGAVTSDDNSPRHVHPSTGNRQSSLQDDEKEAKIEETTGWKYATTRSESLYKDKLGTFHVAKQPPGYTDDRDSHQSESLSDHEPHHRCANDTESQEDRRPYGHPWTSSGSESAYETIRERHRHVDEALASSFEFYSTSPRDARLLGYVSSEAEKDQEEVVKNDGEMKDQLDEEQISELSPLKSELHSVEEYSVQRSTKSKKHSLIKKDGFGSRDSTRFISSFSSHTDEDLNSSQVSIINLQKHRYVRRIQHYIDSLEKLERALVGQFGDSIGSEKSFQRYVTEGRSHTESDSNKTQARDILGQSGTASSSIASSDVSDDGTRRKIHIPRWRRKGILSRSNAHADSQDIPFISTRSEDGAVGPVQQSSLVSSPRISISHRSSDIVSSRTSTLKQIEKEVKMLALAEEKSRHVMRKNEKQKISGRRRAHHYDVQRMHREEPRGEEDPVRSLVASRKGTLDSNISSKCSTPDNVQSCKGSTKKKERVHKVAKTKLASEEEISSQSITDSQISRRGDGRETGDTKQQPTSSAVVTAYSTRNSYKQSSIISLSSNKGNALSKASSSRASQLDFGQMFPSTDCLRTNSFLDSHSVAIQTGNSLLCLDDKDTKCQDNSPCYNSSSNWKKKEQRDSCITIGLEKSKKVNPIVQEPHLMGSGDSHDLSGSESVAISGLIDRNIPTGSSFDDQEKEETQLYEERRAKENSSKYGDKTETKFSKNSEAKDIQQDSRNISPFQPTYLKHVAEVTCRSVRDLSQITTTRSIEQNVMEQNALYSVHSSGRVSKISKDETSARQGIMRDSDANADYNLEECRESEYVPQNDMSNHDLSVGENVSASIKTSESKIKKLEKVIPEISNSSSAIIDVESDKSLTLAQKHKQKDDQSSNLQEICSSMQIPERDIDHGTRSSRGSQDQLTGAVHLYQEIQQTTVHQIPQNYVYLNSTKVNHSSDSSTCGNKGDLVQNTKNCVVVTYSSQFISDENSVEIIHDADFHNGNNDVDRGMKLNMKRKQRDLINARAHSEKTPISFEVNINNKENINRDIPRSKVVSTYQGRSRILADKKKSISLQEALSKARPDYVREAGERRALIRLKQEMRQMAQSRNHEIISQIPTNLQTPSTLQRFLYKPDIAPLFSYRDIREQNRRLYQLLPEANMNQVRSHRIAEDRTNRLISKMYSQKLRNKVLKGLVSHAHKDIVSPPAVQRK
ncbi:serine-rich adhesin for platelets-like isoform X2 [Palaemon carinicauda]|uniref:serine-rich adhesin for platelets-like isoform X2 n=1 Tax=Palaemon carinicauda TaxID=392227 RepID=UPI0035B676D1